MAILLTAAEDIDFDMTSGDTFGYNTTSGVFNSSYSRAGLRTGVSNYRAYTKTITPVTEIYLHCAEYYTYDASATNALIFSFVSRADSDTSQIEMKVTAGGSAATDVTFYYRDGGGTLNSLGTVTIPTTANPNKFIDQLNEIDIYIKLHASSGIIQMYVNEYLYYNYSGALVTQHNVIDAVRFCSPSNTADSNTISQVVVASEDTRGFKLKTLYPDGTGNSAYTTGNYADMDELTYNDTDFATIDTTNQVALSTFSDQNGGDSSKIVKAVNMTTRYEKTSSGAPSDLQLAVRVSSTNYFGPSLGATVGTHYANRLMELNPATTAAWTYSEINALEFGAKGV